MTDNYDVSDIEDLVKDEEPVPEHDHSSLLLSRIAYNMAVAIIDAGTGYLIWQLTFWYYGVIWFLAGAVVFFLHQKNYFTAGNNDKQMRGALTGIIVSVGTMFIMAMVAGGLYVFGVRTQWVEVGLIITSIALFAFHAYQLAMHVFNDDGFRIANTITRAHAQANKKMQIAKASGVVIKAHREAEAEKNKQYKQHGKGNVDAAFSKMSGQPRRVEYAADTDRPELDNNNGNHSKNS